MQPDPVTEGASRIAIWRMIIGKRKVNTKCAYIFAVVKHGKEDQMGLDFPREVEELKDDVVNELRIELAKKQMRWDDVCVLEHGQVPA